MTITRRDVTHIGLQRLAQPGELGWMHHHADPLLDGILTWGGIAFSSLKTGGNRDRDPYVVTHQIGGVMDPADAGLAVQAVVRAQVLNIEPVLAAHVVLGCRARGEHDREIRALPGR